MRFCLFAIRDSKAEIYLSPFPARSEVDAARQILASFSDPQIASTPVGQHPEDFSLMLVGEFDDETGLLVAHAPRLVVELATLSSTVPS